MAASRASFRYNAWMLRPMYFEPPYFVGWGTLMLLNAGVAQGKGRSGLVWFFVSLFLGPLATLILVLLPKK